MVGARSGSRWSAPGAAIWQPVSLAAMPAAQRATIGYSWSPTITTAGTWIWASLDYAGGQRGGGGGTDPEAVPDAPAAGAAHEQQRAPRPHLADGVARDLERQHHVLAERLAHLGCLHLEQRPVARAAGRDHHVVDRCWQVLEESFPGSRVLGVEGHTTLPAQFQRRFPDPVGMAAGEDDIGTLNPGASSGPETDACAAAHHAAGLS